MASFWEKLAQPLPEPSSRARNASAIFGASPSFGISPVPQIQFRPAPLKRVPEPKKVRRSNSDVALRKRPYLRRRSGDFSQTQRKRSESESENRLNGVNCNGTTLNRSESKLSSGSGSDCVDTTADSVCSLPEHSHDPNDFSSRYPLFIQVNNGCQATNKPRIVKPVAKSNQGGFKQDNAQDKQGARPRRSASFSAPKKPGPPSRSPQTAQDSLKNGSLRREKSDIVRPRRTQLSANNNNSLPISARSNSSSCLKRENGIASSPRSQSPAGLQRERSDVTKNRASPSVRREKSDIVRPRGQLRTNSPTVTHEDTGGNICKTSSNRSLTSSSLNKSPSKSSIESGRSRSASSSEMSKIPSLVRSPGSAEKTDSHISRIPSMTKKNGAEERTPPKSKIPSSNKSQIPTTGRKESALQKDKAGSKISPSIASSHNRPDSAKENKDPTSIPNGPEPAKQVSKIPSFSKSSIPKSRIPSVTRKDSHNEGQASQNGGEAHSPATGSQSKMPNASSSSQGSGIPMGVSRIPSFAKSPSASSGTKTPQSKLSTVGGSKATEPDGPPGNSSRTPTLPSTLSNATLESKVPTAGGSRIPEPKTAAKSPPSSLPIASKASGIPKPGELTPSSKIPGYAGDKLTRKTSSAEKETVPTGIPAVASSPVETKSKTPSFPKHAATPKSPANSPNGQLPRTGIPTFGGKQPSFDKEPATPPSTPIRENFSSESPLDKYIFSEARKMEQIFRDEPIEVVVPAADLEEDEEFLRQEKEIEELEETSHDSDLQMLDSKEAEDLISEVLKSYAPDINTENQLELDDSYVFSVRDDNKNFKEKVNIDDIVLKPASTVNEPPKESKIAEKPSTKEDVDVGKAEVGVKDLIAGKNVVQNGTDVREEATKVEEKEAVTLENKSKTRFVSVRTSTQAPPQFCPHHQGNDPNDVNARIKKLKDQATYFVEDGDEEYTYKVTICQQNLKDTTAILQHGKKWEDSDWKGIGTYEKAHVTGGTDWLMIKYFHGAKYTSHCNKLERIGIVVITCDPGVERGTMRIIEEYRNNSKPNDPANPLECYYLFELNNDAACTVKPKHLSPGSIMLIILIVVGSIYITLGFLYQRFMVGAKGMEQIPHYNFWRDCGSLQADGCNYMCRCSESRPTRYKAMDDALADDDRDDTLLPM